MSIWFDFSIKVSRDSGISVRKALEYWVELAGGGISKECDEHGYYLVSIPDCGIAVVNTLNDILADIKNKYPKSNPEVIVKHLVLY